MAVAALMRTSLEAGFAQGRKVVLRFRFLPVNSAGSLLHPFQGEAGTDALQLGDFILRLTLAAKL